MNLGMICGFWERPCVMRCEWIWRRCFGVLHDCKSVNNLSCRSVCGSKEAIFGGIFAVSELN